MATAAKSGECPDLTTTALIGARPNMIAGVALLTAGVLVTMAAFASHPAEAREAPWCASENIGWGTVIEDCSFWSFEQCVSRAIAGNRGFCNQNPRWSGPWPPEQQRTRSRSHRN